MWQRVVRQFLTRLIKFLAGAIVIQITPVLVFRHSEMRFARIGTKATKSLDCSIGHPQSCRSMIEASEVDLVVSVCQLVVGKRKVPITFHRFVEQANSLKKTISLRRAEHGAGNERFAAHIEIVGAKISSRFFFDSRFLSGRKLALKLTDNLFS